MEKKRNSSIELLRIVAMLLIMSYHYNYHGGIGADFTKLGFNGFFAKMMYMGGKVGVNIFVIITSWFMCDEALNCRRIHKQILKTWVPAFEYSVVLFTAAVILRPSKYSTISLLKAFCPVASTTNWFVSAYILFLLMIPFLNAGIHRLSTHEHGIISLFLVIYFSLFQTISGNDYINAWNMASNVTWFIVVFVTVSYIKRIYLGRLNRYVWLLLIIACYAFFALTIYLADYKHIFLCTDIQRESVYMMRINYFPVLICSLSLFFFFKSFTINCKLIDLFGELTFGIYLLHDNKYLRNYLWRNIFLSWYTYKSPYYPLYALGSVVGVFLACAVIEFIRSRISHILEDNLLAFIRRTKNDT